MDSRRIHFIDKAIYFKDKSIKFYEDVAARMKTDGDTNAWQMAITLRDEEGRHKRMLEDLGSQDMRFLQEKADEMGAYSMEGVAKLSFPLKDHKVEEILKGALDREERSIEVYEQLRKAADSDDFGRMVQEETRHHEMVQDELDRLRSESYNS